ncbi:MAG: P1 family peptidase [Myxococcales bacterium]|nr:P1 family peptidase [Myxococcales bacterium]
MPKSTPKKARVRARQLGIRIGHYRPGRYNSITDVSGVRVGHATLVRGEGPLHVGEGPVRTGVTAILPNNGDIFHNRVVGSGFILNGAGEVSGLTQVMEWGLFETPLLLTNTLSVGACSEALVKYMVGRYPSIGNEHDVIIPVVGECDDSWLNDAAGRHVRTEHVYRAISTAAAGFVQEGSVGGGTGMICCDFKGGIGTSSRRLPGEEGGFTVGVLVMTNFGVMRDLRVDGVPVGAILEPEFRGVDRRIDNYGSIIAVVATNAPLLSHQIHRLCKRVALGIGRAGSTAAHGSGEIIVGFSTANTVPRDDRQMIYRIKVLQDPRMNPLYEAAIDATEEAIINALCMAETMAGHSGHTAPAIPLDRLREIMLRYGRGGAPRPAGEAS